MDTEWIQYFGARCPAAFNAAQFTHVTNTKSVCVSLRQRQHTSVAPPNLATIYHTFLCAGRRNVDKSVHWPADASTTSGQGLLR